MNPKLINGIVPPLVTPLLEQDRLDVAGLERLIEYVLAGGVSGLFVLGTTGEGPSLSYRLRREVIEYTCRQTAGRVPILVAITDTAAAESQALAQFAAEQGAAAVVLAPPYYYPTSQPELIEYINDILCRLPLPLMLYNMPAMTKISFDIETVRHMAEQDGIIGMKDSSGNMNYFHHLLRAARPDWSVMMGSEALLAEAVLFGADGGVCGGANFAPKLFVQLHQAAQNHDWNQVRALQSQVLDLSERIYSIGQHPSATIKGIKCALSCLEICGDTIAEPLHAFHEPEREKLRAVLQELTCI